MKRAWIVLLLLLTASCATSASDLPPRRTSDDATPSTAPSSAPPNTASASVLRSERDDGATYDQAALIQDAAEAQATWSRLAISSPLPNVDYEGNALLVAVFAVGSCIDDVKLVKLSEDSEQRSIQVEFISSTVELEPGTECVAALTSWLTASTIESRYLSSAEMIEVRLDGAVQATLDVTTAH